MSKRASCADFFTSEPSIKRQRTVESKSLALASFETCLIPASTLLPSPLPSSSSSKSAPPFPFFSLPAEIRDEIYKHAFIPEGGVSICQCRYCASRFSSLSSSSSSPTRRQNPLAAAMCVSRRFGTEAKRAFYENALFVIDKRWDVNHSRVLSEDFIRHASATERFDDAHTALASEMGEDVWRDRHFALAMARAARFWDLSLVRRLYVRVISEIRPRWPGADVVEEEEEEEEEMVMMGEEEDENEVEGSEDESEAEEEIEEVEDDNVLQLLQVQEQHQPEDNKDEGKQEEHKKEEEEESDHQRRLRLREDFHKHVRAVPVQPPALVYTDAFPEPAGIKIDCTPDDKSRQDLERAMQLLLSGGTMDMMGLGYLLGLRADAAAAAGTSPDLVSFEGLGKQLREVHVMFELERTSFAYGDGEFCFFLFFSFIPFFSFYFFGQKINSTSLLITNLFHFNMENREPTSPSLQRL